MTFPSPSDSAKILLAQGRKRYVGRFMFPPKLRHSIDPIFAFIVYIDDIADDVSRASESRLRSLHAWDDAISMATPAGLDPQERGLFEEFTKTAQRFGISDESVHKYLNGQMWATGCGNFETATDIQRYLDEITFPPATWAHVAFGGTEEFVGLALSTIEAFQRIDFLWDAASDLEQGASRLPLQDVAVTTHDLEGVLQHHWPHPRVTDYVENECGRARELLDGGRRWPQAISPHASLAMRTDRRVHYRMLHHLEQCGLTGVASAKDMGFTSVGVLSDVLRAVVAARLVGGEV